MPTTVLILGAGASASAGAPVMNRFLDRARDYYRRTGNPDCELVFRAIDGLEKCYAKSFLDTRNLESVFVAFEMARLLGKPLAEPTEIDHLIPAFKQVIVRTLEDSMQFPVTEPLAPPDAPAGYRNLAKFLKRESERNRDLCVITFNYDCGLDYALASENVRFSYGLSRTTSRDLPLLKLHGSINWFADKAGEIQSAPIVPQPPPFPVTVPGSCKISFTAAAVKALKLQGERIDPFIVPPTNNKGELHRAIQPVWRAAAEKLASADNIIVAGFSLPPTDEFFRYLFAVGTISMTQIERFWVVDKSATDDLDRRFRALLGPTASSRYALYQGEFDSLAARLADERDALDAIGKHWRPMSS